MNHGHASVGWCSALLLAVVPTLQGATAELELRTLPQELSYGSKDYYLGMTSQQHFFMHRQMSGDDEAAFKAAVEKEPKYECDHPIKRVARLGSYEYAFVLDSTGLAKRGYDKWFLDRNRNGDLTDEEPIKAKRMDGMFGGSYRRREFPLQTLEVKADGKVFECPCSLDATSNISEDGQVDYASASLRNRAYREGKITVDGKVHHIFLLDYNNNGAFNDLFTMDTVSRMHDGRLYPTTGDMVLTNPDFSKDRYGGYGPVDSPDRHYLSKLLNIDGKYYKIETTASGDKITLEPAALPMGAVANDSGLFGAVLFGEHGLVKVTGDKGKPAAVPAGDWSLLEYQIDLGQAPKAAAATKPATSPAPAPAAPKKKTLGQKLANLFGADTDSGPGVVFNQPKYTLVRARAKAEAKPVKVGKDKTELLRFGPPYKPVVSVSYLNDKDANLELKLVGSAGEVCETMMIKGSQPSQPKFKILKKNGDLVKKGQFDYG